MSFTNINVPPKHIAILCSDCDEDPAGVKSLLEQLKASQAWQDVVNEQKPEPSNSDPQTQYPTQPAPSATVASLLSQLESSSSFPSSSVPAQPGNIKLSIDEQSSAAPSHDGRRSKDIRSLTYQQTLPILAKLSEDTRFIHVLTDLKKRQDDLEQQLFSERTAIHQKFQEKVQVAKTKAHMIGVAISKHEADMLMDAYKRELAKFDRERVLTAWDALVSQQQDALSRLGVPTMFQTESTMDMQRQLRVMRALEGML